MRRIALGLAAALTVASIAAWAVAGSVPAVSFFPAAQVTAAFAKGAVLYDGQGTNYMVHASRREGPGQCEIHTLDTDIIYVVAGASTFVTGGSCTDPTTVADHEIRGTAIAGGETRRIAAGDVVIVPHDTPHWFKQVDPPVLYYVVKVR